MMHLSVSFDSELASRWVKGIDGGLQKAAAQSLTKTAIAARADITRQIPSIFKSVTPSTRRAVLFLPADAAKPISQMVSIVYVRDEGGAKSVPPSKYLRAEVLGGSRAAKRSERALQNKGLLPLGSLTVPSGQVPITGPLTVKILSQLNAFGEQGYRANATLATRRRLRRKGVPVHKQTGTQYFIARDKRTRDPIGIYQVVGRGVVKPILWFDHRSFNYQQRFKFNDLVAAAVGKTWPVEFMRAIKSAASSGT